MKKRTMVSLALALAAGLLSLPVLDVAQAAEGWVQSEGKWSYYDKNSNAAADVWIKSNNIWHYIASDGIMLTDKVFKDGDLIYCVDEEGAMVSNAWKYASGDKLFDGELEEGWYYFGKDGSAYRRKGSSFKKNINGSNYVFDENGKLLTGWFDSDGEPVSDSENPFVDGMYYAGEDGRLLKNEWLDYGAIDNGIGGSELDSEVAGRSYNDYEKMWIYFDSNSKKIKSNGDNIRQMTLDGIKYGFDENGIMLPWWSKVSTISNADKSNPTSDVSARYYSGYDGGKLLKNTWFWMYPSESMDEDEYCSQDCSWWYTNSSGEVYKDRISRINGRYYAFDGLGRMQTGFVLFDGKSEFVARYDIDAWESDAFIDGSIFGIEKSDLYLFSTDEKNDGSMQTGKEIKLELADGVYTFGFSSNGKAYGNKNKLQKKNDKYYINGLRLDADDEYGYGVVEVEDGDDIYYQVVNSSGKVVDGSKKIVKDKDGAYLLIINNHFVARCSDESKPRWRETEEGTGYYHYDKDNKDDHYADGIIAADDEDPDVDSLPEEERLNF